MHIAAVRGLIGIVSGGAILGVAELLSSSIDANSAPFYAFGSVVIDHTPDGFREWAIQTFGTNDKLALYVVMAVVAVGLAAGAGLLEQRRRPLGSALLSVFGLLCATAALTRADATWVYAIPTVVGVLVGIWVLRSLVGRLDRTEPVERPDQVPDADRRRVLGLIAAAGGAALAAGVLGRYLGSKARDVTANRAAVQLPAPKTPAPVAPPGAELDIDGLSTFVTPNPSFYRIDTALVFPRVTTDDWSLRIHGMVDRELNLRWADLANRQVIERYVTLACVSNPVGGDLVGNARWLGYPLRDLLAEAGPHPDADMVLSTSADDFTAGSPLDVLMDGRDAMLAVGMNGEPLPVAHGFPARLVVPGLYGYVSATKWVVDIEVTRFDRVDAYWTKRGWSPRGPIKTASRIDTPGAKVPAGKVPVAGVAWAQHRGIKAVEVQVDDGAWQLARLAQPPSADTWCQWVYEWDATQGDHTIRCRATDGTGEVQTSAEADVIPDGATGYHDLRVRVS